MSSSLLFLFSNSHLHMEASLSLSIWPSILSEALLKFHSWRKLLCLLCPAETSFSDLLSPTILDPPTSCFLLPCGSRVLTGHSGCSKAGTHLGLSTLSRGQVGTLFTSKAPARCQAPMELTAVYLLHGEMLLQVPPELHFISILAHSPIITQDEVRVHAVECGELAERVTTQSLVHAHYLRDSKDERTSELKVLPRLHWF